MQTTVTWEPNENTSQKKFQKVVTMYKVNKRVIKKINWKTASKVKTKF
jgi:hypothetical protein